MQEDLSQILFPHRAADSPSGVLVSPIIGFREKFPE